MIKVGYYSPGWPRSHYPNGIVSYIDNLIAGTKNEIDSYIFSENVANSYVEDGLKIVDLSKIPYERNVLEGLFHKVAYKTELPFFKIRRQSIPTQKTAKRIAAACNQLESLDLIEVEESFGIGHFLTKVTNIPVVTRLHGPWRLVGENDKEKNKIEFNQRVAFEKKAIFNANGVTSPSLYTLDFVRNYYGDSLPHAAVIPNPVKLVSSENCWKYNSNQRNILFVGRFDVIKGADLMLKAFRIIALKDKQIILNFVGPDRGLVEDGVSYNFQEYLLHAIPEQSIRDRIVFHGHSGAEKVALFRKWATVTLMTSRFENFSLALLEGMAAGCPTVATAVGGNPEIVKDGFNGKLAAESTPECIAENVMLLLNDESKMSAISKAAILDIKNRFSPEVVAAQTIAYYKSIV